MTWLVGWLIAATSSHMNLLHSALSLRDSLTSDIAFDVARGFCRPPMNLHSANNDENETVPINQPCSNLLGK
ncbi:hypothetical protein BKA82DRAFT_4150505 [Pisolithus tinctorius]|nr:hypothetical protein BKA82DRAFT_4150505 [Pisolithus tinctorius]